MEREFSVKEVITKKDNPEISLAVIKLKGLNNRIVNLNSDAVYMCINGTCIFVKEDNSIIYSFVLRKGDRIKIEKETPYLDYSENGTTLIAINKPAFDEDKIQNLPVTEEILDIIRTTKIKTLLTKV